MHGQPWEWRQTNPRLLASTPANLVFLPNHKPWRDSSKLSVFFTTLPTASATWCPGGCAPFFNSRNLLPARRCTRTSSPSQPNTLRAASSRGAVYRCSALLTSSALPKARFITGIHHSCSHTHTHIDIICRVLSLLDTFGPLLPTPECYAV